MNLRRGKLPFSLYSFRAGFTLSFGFVTIWSLKRSTTKAMASTPPRRSYRVCSVIVYSSLSFLGRIRSAHGPILLIRAVRTAGSSARESLIYHATLRLRLHYCGAWPFPSSCPYSPECVEGTFCELRLYLILRSSLVRSSNRGDPDSMVSWIDHGTRDPRSPRRRLHRVAPRLAAGYLPQGARSGARRRSRGDGDHQAHRPSVLRLGWQRLRAPGVEGPCERVSLRPPTPRS